MAAPTTTRSRAGPAPTCSTAASGTDQVSYENSRGRGRLQQGAGRERRLLGEGGDAEGDRLVSIEYIIGSAFNDTLAGNPNQGNTLEGRAGNDTLVGGNTTISCSAASAAT